MLEFILVLGYIVLTTFLGWYLTSRAKARNDINSFFVGRKELSWLLVMFVMFGEKVRQAPSAGIPCLVIGLFAGIGIGSSAIMQGRCAAAAADAQGETGKGFTNYLAAIGIIETVAIFTMVFALIGVVKFGA